MAQPGQIDAPRAGFELAENPEAIQKLWSRGPDLTGADITKLCFRTYGIPLETGFNLPCFPDKPLRRWLLEFGNAVHIILHFSELIEVQLQGWTTLELPAP